MSVCQAETVPNAGLMWQVKQGVKYGNRARHRKKVVGEPYEGKPHVRLCVQLRLACSAGDRPAGVKARSPVAWIAGWRETEILKPIDNAIRGMVASHQAVTKVNA